MRNGEDEETPNTLRLIGLVARMNDALRDFSGELRLSSDRSARVESAVEDIKKDVRELHRVAIGIDHDVEEIRRDQTDPKGHRLLDPAKHPLREKDDDGTGFEITAEQVRLPNAWAFAVLKFGVSAGGGALFLRLVQWAATGH